MRPTTGLLMSSLTCVGLGVGALLIAAPAQAAGERVVLHADSYENKPGSPVGFGCLASPSLVGKTAQIKEVGGAVLASVKIKKNGSCDMSVRVAGKGEREFIVVVQYQSSNGTMKTVMSNAEQVLLGKDT